MPMVVAFGEILLRLTSPGRAPLLHGPSLDTCFGGAEANVAVALAHLGTTARLASVLPDNALGDAAIGELRRHGVEVSAIERAPGRLGLYFLAMGSGARASQVLYDRAGSAFALIDAGRADWSRTLDRADWLHLSGVTLAVSEAAELAARRTVEVAMAKGVRVSFDGNFRPQLWTARGGDPRSTINWFLTRADLAFVDHRDLALITGEPIDEERANFAWAAQGFFAKYQKLAYVAATHRQSHSHDRQTLTGMLATRDEGITTSRDWTLDAVVDRIGSGDAFAAGMLHALIEQMSPERAIAFATALGALKHTLPGDFCTASAVDVQAAIAGMRDVRR